MTWFKVDDRFHSHPKVLALRAGPCEDSALALWLRAGSWCAANLTDGEVPAYVLDSLCRKNGTKAADELVRVRLWEATDDGYRFRSWSEYQPNRDEVESKRAESRERVTRYREKQRNASVTRYTDVTPNECNANVTPPPTRPDPTYSPTESVRTPARGTSAMLATLTPNDRTADVIRAVSDARQAAGGGAWRAITWTDKQQAQAIAEHLDALGGVDGLRLAADSYFAQRGKGSPIKWFAEDPGQWATTKPTAPSPTDTGSAHLARDAELKREEIRLRTLGLMADAEAVNKVRRHNEMRAARGEAPQ